MATADKSMLSRGDHVRLKIEQLEDLKKQMRGFDGDRLSRLKSSSGFSGEHADADDEGHESEPQRHSEHSEAADAGDHEGGAEHMDAADDGDGEASDYDIACPHCGGELSEGDESCPHCQGEIAQEGGGEEGGIATDTESSGTEDGDRLEKLAHKKGRG